MEDKALLFIPDISGFTEFVKESEAQHSQHIIKELLEIIIDANNIKLEVSEIEGDAILFYRFGKPPEIDQLVDQTKRMFLEFHEHLKVYERDRICQCGACSNANKLTLKFMVHFGNVSLLNIKEHTKLMGEAVIVAHRLLKNDVNDNEYVLMSKAYLKALGGHLEKESYPWVTLSSGETNYAEIGEIKYDHFTLTPLHKEVKTPPKRKSITKTSNPVSLSIKIKAPMLFVHKVITDLEIKPKLGDLEDVIYQKDRVPRVGTVHDCILPSGKLEIEATENMVDSGHIEYGEHVKNVPILGATDNIFYLSEENGVTDLKYELHYRPENTFRKLLFALLRVPLKMNFKKLLIAIKDYSEANGRPN